MKTIDTSQLATKATPSFSFAHSLSTSSPVDMLFEASWEVCNKCGGIYTVLSSKADYLLQQHDLYFTVGPLFENKPLPSEFIPRQAPASFAAIFSQLAKKGIRCEYGVWDIIGRPKTILVSCGSKITQQKNTIKKELWDSYGVDSLYVDGLFDEPLLWSWAVGQLVDYTQKFFSTKNVLLHAHEWLSGAALLYLEKNNSRVARVFTTHATMLGRSLSSRRIDPLYFPKNKGDALQNAKEIGIIEKHTMEYACMHCAHHATTVSSITAQECKDFFEKEVSIVPNGISSHQQLTFEESSYNHIVNKRKLRKFLLEYFFPYYVFDVNNTLFFYTSGRYEFENKGLDVALEAAAKLNKRLKSEASTKTVVLFCTILPWATHMQPRRDVLQNKNNLLKLYDALEEHRQALEEQVIIDVLSQSTTPGPSIISKSLPDVFSPELITSLEKEFRRSKQTGNPPLCSHSLTYEHDPIIEKCFSLGLTNDKEDRVKIVFIPSYLDGRDGVLDMHYLDFIQGCHLGIFPSRYEPWGYTPLESIAQAVPAITSSQTGFGRFMKPLLSQNYVGLHVVNYTQHQQKFVHDVYTVLEKFVFSSKQDRVKSKLNAQEVSLKASWSHFIPLYEEVYTQAMKTIVVHKENNKNTLEVDDK